MKLSYLLILCFSISIASLSAQSQFHRTYELVLGDSIQTSGASISPGGAYYNVGAFIEDGAISALQVNGFDGKGDVEWSKLIYSADSISFSGLASIHYHLDTIFVAASISATNTNKVLLTLDGRGNPIKTTYYKNEDLDNQAPVQVSSFLGADILWSATTIVDGSSTRASVSRLKTNGDVAWNRTFAQVRNNTNIPTINQNSNYFQDSTISVVGRTIEATSNNFSTYISRLDTLGSEIWSKEYALNSMNQHQVVFYTTAYASDSTTVAIGNITDLNIESGIITMVDSVGEEVWTKQVSLGNSPTELYDVNVTEAGLIHVYGESVDDILNTTTSFLLELDSDGNQLQLIEYPVDVIAPEGKSVSMLPTPSDGGYAIFGPASDSVTLVNNFIKVDASLMTPCSVVRTDTILNDINLIVSPIEWAVDTAFDPIDSISTVVNYNGIVVPTLMLTDTTYCPQDPIMKLYDAFQEEATAYIWNTGDTTSSIIATEEGMFMVTVTMGEKVCYSFCDTVMISKYELPAVSISRSDVNFCDDQTIRLSMIYNEGAPYRDENVVWSTGETGLEIDVDAVGSYSVVVTDDCGNVATASVNIDGLPDVSGMVTLVQAPEECTNKIKALYIGPGEILGYLWNTGETGDSIFAENPGNYSVSATNSCGKTSESNIEINFDDLNGEISIEPLQIDSCEDRSFLLRSEYQGPTVSIFPIAYEWSKLGNPTVIGIDNEIVLEELGEYKLVVTNSCELKDSVIYDLQPESTGVEWPYVFFPNGIETENRTFGPVIACPDLVSNYELHVFNRYGNEVFESSEVTDRWDGKHNDDDSVGAVYVWWAKYTLDGVEKVDKGDINLIR